MLRAGTLNIRCRLGPVLEEIKLILLIVSGIVTIPATVVKLRTSPESSRFTDIL
jgi:hypothetical protein